MEWREFDMWPRRISLAVTKIPIQSSTTPTTPATASRTRALNSSASREPTYDVCTRAVMIPEISDSGIGITIGLKEPESEPIPGWSRHHGRSRHHWWNRHHCWNRLHCWNSSIVESAPLRKDEQACDEVVRAFFLDVWRTNITFPNIAPNMKG